MANEYFRAMEARGFSYNTTASVRKLECPRCGFRFSLVYARAIACQGCSEAVKGCPKVRCNKCDYEFPISVSADVLNENQENTLANHICDIVKKHDEGRGIEVFNR